MSFPRVIRRTLTNRKPWNDVSTRAIAPAEGPVLFKEAGLPLPVLVCGLKSSDLDQPKLVAEPRQLRLKKIIAGTFVIPIEV